MDTFHAVIASFSLRHKRHRLELWFYELWVPKIFQDMFEFLFTDLIFQYPFDSFIWVWHLILLNVFLWFTYLKLFLHFLNDHLLIWCLQAIMNILCKNSFEKIYISEVRLHTVVKSQLHRVPWIFYFTKLSVARMTIDSSIDIILSN